MAIDYIFNLEPGYSVREKLNAVIDAVNGAVGEANTTSNAGGGHELALPKDAPDLPFRTLVAGADVFLNTIGDTVEISATAAGEDNTSSNKGGGAELALPKEAPDLPFRTLVAGANVIINQLTDTIEISASGTGGGVTRHDELESDSILPDDHHNQSHKLYGPDHSDLKNTGGYDVNAYLDHLVTFADAVWPLDEVSGDAIDAKASFNLAEVNNVGQNYPNDWLDDGRTSSRLNDLSWFQLTNADTLITAVDGSFGIAMEPYDPVAQDSGPIALLGFRDNNLEGIRFSRFERSLIITVKAFGEADQVETVPNVFATVGTVTNLVVTWDINGSTSYTFNVYYDQGGNGQFALQTVSGVPGGHISLDSREFRLGATGQSGTNTAKYAWYVNSILSSSDVAAVGEAWNSNKLGAVGLDPQSLRDGLFWDGTAWAIDRRVNWVTPYAIGPTYEQDDMVLDTGWLCIANQQTVERAAPQATGTIYNPTFEAAWLNDEQTQEVIVGNEYTFASPAYFENMMLIVLPANVGLVHTISIHLDSVLVRLSTLVPTHEGEVFIGVNHVVTVPNSVLTAEIKVANDVGNERVDWTQDEDYWLTYTPTAEIASVTGTKDGVADNNAYGIDIVVQPADISEHWDRVSAPSGSASGGGGFTPTTYTGRGNGDGYVPDTATTDTQVLVASGVWEEPSTGSGDMTKAVYDPTAIDGDAFDMGNMAENTNANILTDAERAEIEANTAKVGVEAGGLAGQVYTKTSNTDYDAEWADATGGLTEVFDDKSPSLGGTLDALGETIDDVGNVDLSGSAIQYDADPPTYIAIHDDHIYNYVTPGSGFGPFPEGCVMPPIVQFSGTHTFLLPAAELGAGSLFSATAEVVHPIGAGIKGGPIYTLVDQVKQKAMAGTDLAIFFGTSVLLSPKYETEAGATLHVTRQHGVHSEGTVTGTGITVDHWDGFYAAMPSGDGVITHWRGYLAADNSPDNIPNTAMLYLGGSYTAISSLEFTGRWAIYQITGLPSKLNGALFQAVREVTAEHSVELEDYIINCNSGVTMLLNLPLCSDPSVGGIPGRVLIVNNIGAGRVDINPSGSDQINGSTGNFSLTQYQSAVLVSDGDNWFVVGDAGSVALTQVEADWVEEVHERFTKATASTVGNAWTTVSTLPLVMGDELTGRVVIGAKRTDAVSYYKSELQLVAWHNGTANVDYDQTYEVGPTQLDIRIITAGDDLLFQVKGVAGQSWDWKGVAYKQDLDI